MSAPGAAWFRVAAGCLSTLTLATLLTGCAGTDTSTTGRTWQVISAWNTPADAGDAPEQGFTHTPELVFSRTGVTGSNGCELLQGSTQWLADDGADTNPDVATRLRLSASVVPADEVDPGAECSSDARAFADRMTGLLNGEFTIHRVDASRVAGSDARPPQLRLSRADEDVMPGTSPRGIGLVGR